MDAKNKIFTIVGATALVAAAGIGGAVLFFTPDEPAERQSISTSPSSTNAVDTPSVTDTAPESTVASALKDGTYTASSNYHVPNGAQNTLTATIAITNGTISSVKMTSNYADSESGMYIDSFESNVNADATGRDIASYSPSRIGGASLTTAAFNNVLDTVRSAAAT